MSDGPYTPRGEWDWNKWERKPIPKEAFIVCAVLNLDFHNYLRNIILFGQPTDPNEAGDG